MYIHPWYSLGDGLAFKAQWQNPKVFKTAVRTFMFIPAQFQLYFKMKSLLTHTLSEMVILMPIGQSSFGVPNEEVHVDAQLWRWQLNAHVSTNMSQSQHAASRNSNSQQRQDRERCETALNTPTWMHRPPETRAVCLCYGHMHVDYMCLHACDACMLDMYCMFVWLFV